MGPEAASNLTQLRQLGWCAGLPSEEILAKIDPETRESDEGAVAIRVHPAIMIAQHEELWPMINRWRAGVGRELTRKDYDRLSNLEIEAFLVMAAAQARDDLRSIPKPVTPGAPSS